VRFPRPAIARPPVARSLVGLGRQAVHPPSFWRRGLAGTRRRWSTAAQATALAARRICRGDGVRPITAFCRGVRQTWSGDRSPRHLAPRIARPRAQGAGTWSRSTRFGVACRCLALFPARRGHSLAAGVADRCRATSYRRSGGGGRGGASPASPAARPFARLAGSGRPLRCRAGRRASGGCILGHRALAGWRGLTPVVAAGGNLARRPASPPSPAARFGARRRIAQRRIAGPGGLGRPALCRLGGPIWCGFGRRRFWRFRADPIARRVVGWRRHRERFLRWRYLVPGGGPGEHSIVRRSGGR
jgi:hypothetical protein